MCCCGGGPWESTRHAGNCVGGQLHSAVNWSKVSVKLFHRTTLVRLMNRSLLLLAFAFIGLMWLRSLSAQSTLDKEWQYNPSLLRPFWQGDTVEKETALFIQNEVTSEGRASVLFPITRVLSVSNSAGDKTYEEGRDYVWRAGSREIILPAGSRIVSQTPQDLRRPAKSQKYELTHRDGNGEIFFGAMLEYHEMQTSITYEHAIEPWDGSRPKFAVEVLPRTIDRLRRKRLCRLCYWATASRRVATPQAGRMASRFSQLTPNCCGNTWRSVTEAKSL